MTQRDKLIYIASFVMLAILVALIGYLTFIPVPIDNKDIIITILGVILGGGAAAMPNLFGDKDEETEKLKNRIDSLEKQLDIITAQYKDVSKRYETVLGMLVDRHFIPPSTMIPPVLPNEMKRFTDSEKGK